jgi:hypothetical protein
MYFYARFIFIAFSNSVMISELWVSGLRFLSIRSFPRRFRNRFRRAILRDFIFSVSEGSMKRRVGDFKSSRSESPKTRAYRRASILRSLRGDEGDSMTGRIALGALGMPIRDHKKCPKVSNMILRELIWQEIRSEKSLELQGFHGVS